MFAEFLETLQARYGTGDNNSSISEWITANTQLKGKPFSFRSHPFQRQIVDDLHTNLVVRKCSQCGLTEIQIRKFFALLTRGNSLNGIFTLPSELMYKRIYSGRMSPILTGTPVFNPPTLTSPVRRNDLVQIRDSFGYITGCTEGDATSISADILFHDEYDLSPQDIIGLFPSRLQGSDLAMTQSFSTPSIINFGIDKAYNISDQNEYHVRCDSCNHWQVPKFNDSFVCIPGLPDDLAQLTDLTIEQIADLPVADTYVRCERCQRRLDLSRADNREWVATYPSRTFARGYNVRPFSVGRLTPAYILDRLSKAKQLENVRGFHNTVLGEAFTDSQAQIQRNEVEAVMASTGNPPIIGPSVPCYLGFDVGQTCHLAIIAERPDRLGHDFVLFDTCHISQLRDRIAEYRKRYNLIQGCGDRYPYTPDLDALRELTGSLIMPVQQRGAAPLTRTKDENGTVTHYSANRTGMIDRVRTVIVNKQTVLGGYGPYRETILAHLTDMVRNDRADQEPSWEKISGNDHFHHACAFALLAPRIADDAYNNAGGSRASTVMVMALNGNAKNMPGLNPQSRFTTTRSTLI